MSCRTISERGCRCERRGDEDEAQEKATSTSIEPSPIRPTSPPTSRTSSRATRGERFVAARARPPHPELHHDHGVGRDRSRARARNARSRGASEWSHPRRAQGDPPPVRRLLRGSRGANGAPAIAQRVLDEEGTAWNRTRTQAAVVGAGRLALLAHLLSREGIETVLLEDRSREYVEAWSVPGSSSRGCRPPCRDGRREASRTRGSGSPRHRAAVRRRAPPDTPERAGRRAGDRHLRADGRHDLIRLRLDGGRPLHFEVEKRFAA